MAVQVAPPPATVHTRLNYYLEVDQGGITDLYPGTAADKLRQFNSQPVNIQDLRCCNEQFTVDENGFQLVQHKSAEKTFDDEARVKAKVYLETSSLLKNVTGATHVVPFSHVIRRNKQAEAIEASEKVNPTDIIKVMNPAMYCHVDQSYNGAVQILNDNLSADDASRLAKTRWGIINVWRPIERPILREPLAVCDWNSVQETDLRPVTLNLPQKGAGTFDHVSKGSNFEGWNIASNPDHRWFYASQMTPDEALFIKCFDSRKDRARLSPHTAFQSELDQGPARQSIEIRCLVFWEDQSVE